MEALTGAFESPSIVSRLVASCQHELCLSVMIATASMPFDAENNEFSYAVVHVLMTDLP